MDRYTKFILTIIAVALVGINYHLFNGKIISNAEASHGYSPHVLKGGGSLHVTIDNWPSGLK